MDQADLLRRDCHWMAKAKPDTTSREQGCRETRQLWMRVGSAGLAILPLAIAGCLLTGCRGSRPFAKFAKNVEVTPQSDVNLPELEPPQQRLAGAGTPTMPKTRNGRTSVSKEALAAAKTEVSVSVEGAEKAATTKTARRSTTSKLRDNAIVKTSLTKEETADAGNRTAKRARKTLQRDLLATRERITRERDSAKNKLASAKKKTAEDAVAKKSDAKDAIAKSTPAAKAKTPTATSPEEKELMEAFSDYPPEVRREALRRLIASTAKRAEKTGQPADLQDALEDNLDSLPTLPASNGKSSTHPATRLASGKSGSDQIAAAAQNKAAALNQSAAQNKSASAAASAFVGDEPAKTETPKESMPQVAAKTTSAPIQYSVTSQAGSVKTASASTVADTQATVAQATPSANPGDTSAVKPASVMADPMKLDDRELYKALVKKLAVAPSGESESERASRLIKLRYLTVLSGDVDSAVEKIDGMNESEQEFLRHQLLGLWTMVDPSGHPVASRRITTALPQLREATKFAAAATDSLEVRSLAFCTEIESYGQIKPFPGNRFDAGQQVILYCEIENFTADSIDDGFQTHLQGSYDIFNEKNEKVVSQLLPADQQTSANYLRDYFIAYQMHLPKQLAAGTYRLQLTMEDVKGKKYGQSSIPLEIAK